MSELGLGKPPKILYTRPMTTTPARAWLDSHHEAFREAIFAVHQAAYTNDRITSHADVSFIHSDCPSSASGLLRTAALRAVLVADLADTPAAPMLRRRHIRLLLNAADFIN
jgi:hypothetical protein